MLVTGTWLTSHCYCRDGHAHERKATAPHHVLGFPVAAHPAVARARIYWEFHLRPWQLRWWCWFLAGDDGRLTPCSRNAGRSSSCSASRNATRHVERTSLMRSVPQAIVASFMVFLMSARISGITLASTPRQISRAAASVRPAFAPLAVCGGFYKIKTHVKNESTITTTDRFPSVIVRHFD